MDFTNALPRSNGSGGGGIDNFDAAGAAPEYVPVPPGIYSARLLRGEFTATTKGDDAYRMRFEIADGAQTGKTLVRTWTFGSKALPYTKRDLAPFGLTTSAKLLEPFPPADKDVFVRLVVALQRGDDGIERNDLKRIDQIRFVDSPTRGFMLPDDKSEGGKDVAF